MKIVQLSIVEFNNYIKTNPLSSFHQTINYAWFMAEQGYDYELIGYKDDKDNILAASLILLKKLNIFYKYGYAPKGFLIDYYNKKLLKSFTEAICKYYAKRKVVFLKINPEIFVADIDINNKQKKSNKNIEISKTLESIGYKKIEQVNPFMLKIPKYNAITILKNSDLKNLKKQMRNKVFKAIKLGLTLEKVDREGIKVLYQFIKNKKKVSINHYYSYYNSFDKDNMIDVFLIKLDLSKCLINLKEMYELELQRNNTYVNALINNNNNDKNLKIKLDSDKSLNFYKENIDVLTKELTSTDSKYIAGAMTIKYKNRVNIIISGYDLKYKAFCPNHFLHYQIMQYYKNDYDFLDLNGISGDFSDSNHYKGLDDFKFSFNPLAYEYIGEFDLVINKVQYKKIQH